jgi:hypothetical protein
MYYRHFSIGVLAALATFTWTGSARAGDTEADGLNADVAAPTLGADRNADTVLVGHRGGHGFTFGRSNGFGNRFSSRGFNRFDNRFSFRRFDRIEDRLEAQLRFADPARFRQFDRLEDRLEAQLRLRAFNRFDNRFSFRRFDRIEDRLEAQLRFADPARFRQFDRLEDRLEAQRRFGRFAPIADHSGNGMVPLRARSAKFAFPAYGDPQPTAAPPEKVRPEDRVVTLPAKQPKSLYRAYGE